MELSLEKTAFLLLIAAVVAMLTRKLRLPYSVGLVAAGVVIALLPFSPSVNLTKNLLFTALLPPLIFEAAFYLSWKQLRKDLSVVVVLATLGVVLSVAVTAAGMHYLADWQWLSALVFGVLIAATDPVSVIATFKEAKAHGRLLLLVESESLFNDGTAAVLFAIVLESAAGQDVTPLNASLHLLVMGGGSLLCGALVAGAALLLTGRTDDHLVEITFTTVAAYGSFLLAEHFRLSGVLATLTAGLMMGNIGPLGVLTDRGRESVQAFWEYAAFVANSLIFLMIGMREAHQNFLAGWPSILLALLLVTMARAVAVYPCCALFSWSGLRVALRHQHVLFWGGLRGALALALALALPPEMPQRESIVTVSFAVVAFSVFIQGLTLSPLLRAFGEIPAAHRSHPATSP
ncbi:MAG TPA: sodium:proton antiporter [Bryobacteraceae bacterium]|jgi:CPA1 family monovalent cation:H+ antiporter